MAEMLTGLGGRPGLTKALRIAWDKYNIEQQTQGLQSLDWPVWLQQNGYQLGPDNLVQPAADSQVSQIYQRALSQ
jgi:hypothetical protein